MTSVKPLHTGKLYKPHQQMTITEHQVPDLGQVQTNSGNLNVLKGTNIHPYLKQ